MSTTTGATTFDCACCGGTHLCNPTCVSDPELTCCVFGIEGLEDGLTPDFVDLFINSVVASANVEFDGLGNTWHADGSGLAGLHVRLVRGTAPGGRACDYMGEVDVTGLAKILFDPAAGGGETDIVDFARLRVIWTPGSTPSFEFIGSDGGGPHVDCTTPPLCTPGPGNFVEYFIGNGSDEVTTFVSCCKSWDSTSSNPFTGAEDWNTLAVTGYSVVPC